MATHYQASSTITTTMQTTYVEQLAIQELEKKEYDYSQRTQWLRAAVLGANDGLVTIASLMIGVGSARQDVKAMTLIGFAGLVAGACSMAIGEFVSVYSQRDIELAHIKRNKEESDEAIKAENLPNPVQAALASALAFTMGVVVPLLAAVFIGDYKVRLGVVVGATTAGIVCVWRCRGSVGEGTSVAVLFEGVGWWMASHGHNFWVDKINCLNWTLRNDAIFCF